jgi:phospholipid transport system substrate-binding protein
MRATRLALAVLTLAVGLASAATGEGPRAVVKRMTDAALDVLRDKSLSSDQKRHRLEEVVFPEVDFDTMSRLVLARNWSRFSAPQQADFVKEFKAHLSMTYGRNIENYRNERVEIVGDQDEGRGDWLVKSKIVRTGGAEDIQVDYRLRKEGDAWRIIDMVIERVSLVANFRSQFQEIVSQGGPEKVLELLRDKNARGEPLAT